MLSNPHLAGREGGNGDTARDRLVHVLYVATHRTAVAVRGHIPQAEWDSRHLPGRSVRQNGATVGAARAVLDRLDASSSWRAPTWRLTDIIVR